jgi:D-alanyl-D-alanine carboxypeptidase
MIRALLAPFAALLLNANAPPPAINAGAISAALDATRAPGTILIARGDKIVFERAFGLVDPTGRARHRLGQTWRWASVTKQITATIAMQEVAAGKLDLDVPVIRYLPDSKAPFANRITSRMLMQHISGLPRTEDGPMGKDGWPTFYMVERDSPETGRAYCEGPTKREPPSGFFTVTATSS